MAEIYYETLTSDNFSSTSLDGFIRHQEVTQCWMRIHGQLQLRPVSFTEEWDQNKLRSVADEILQGIRSGGTAIGARCNGQIIGFALVCGKRFGSANQYTELQLLHVSEPFRKLGIGRKLFELAADAAQQSGAKKLYISAHSSLESQAAYRRMGCTEALEPDAAHVAAEPFDIQMEYVL